MKELAWAFLPEGLEEYFDLESYKKDENSFKIVLIEKNKLPEDMPPEYHGKKVINTVTHSIHIDDFPIRGRKCVIVLKRRCWKFEGVQKMLMRKLNMLQDGMRYTKDFAAFLKELDRQISGTNQSGSEK